MAKPGKGKTLGGAPRSGRWTKQPEETRMGGRHRGSLIALGVLGVLLLAGFGAFMGWANSQLGGGLLRQEREARRRPDWVPLHQLPGYARAAFETVLDTTSTLRRPRYDNRGGRAHLSRDLVRQVYQLRGGVQDGMREAAFAQLLEVRSSESQRMELYLNRVAMGRTENWAVYGIQHASQEYFGKDVRRLTLGEAATLAGILLEPRIRDPEAVPGAVGARRNEVLRLMAQARRIGQAQLQAALAEPLSFQPGEDYAPMTQPLNRAAQPEVIRLPEALRPRLDGDSVPRSPGQ
ncbi:MAG TPA: transglycosylase domain-containing protein [Longimicrobium sp.]|uniref:transglycosylase domain-containing protein n=1 Tax=Longimicrobium sp. TaxID=2029185 RepID=UPI002EDAE254